MYDTLFFSRLEEEMLDIKMRWEANSAEISRVNVAKDLELNALKDNEIKLRSELEQSGHAVKRSVLFVFFCFVTVMM